ncbi:MAG: hypothetical protein IPJ77_22175 [Planctomycetes bacterium]|nr:hypothetical protein [Planctomycetota bacterium]
MTKHRVLALSVAFVVLGSGAALAFYRGARSTQSEEHRSTSAVPISTDAPRSLEKSIVLSSGVGAEISVSLLPALATSDGRSLRPVRINALYVSGPMTLVGQTLYHELLNVDSTETVDVSAHGLDVGGPIGPEQIRSFSVTLAPIAGRTWGTLDDLANELTITAAPASH